MSEPVRRLSEQHRERIARGLRRHYNRLRQQRRVLPADLKALRSRTAPIPPSLRADAQASAVELEEVLIALGGETASPQRIVLAEDAARLGLLGRALLRRFAETQDPELASRIATVLGARRANLSAVGLDRVARELDLGVYLANRNKNSEEAEICPPDDAEGRT